MARGALKVCTLLLLLFLAAPQAFCLHCCCTADEPVAPVDAKPHGCCAKAREDGSNPTLNAKAACDCPELYEPMVAVAAVAGSIGDSCDSARCIATALLDARTTLARPQTTDEPIRPAAPAEALGRPRASTPSRAPPAVTV